LNVTTIERPFASSAGGVGLLGPVSLHAVRDLIAPSSWRDDLPEEHGATSVSEIARVLVARGHRVVIFTTAALSGPEICFEGPNLRICVGPYRPQGRARDFFAHERAYLQIAIARERPAVVHAHWTYEYALAAQASGLPCLVTAHDAPWRVLRLQPIPYRVMRTIMAYRVLRKAPQIACVSPYIASHLRRWMGFRGRSSIVPNGLPEHYFAPPLTRSHDRWPTFGCIANGWGRIKNTATLLHAFKLVRATIPTARLLIFGMDHGTGQIAEQWAQDRDLTEGVQFIGALPREDLMARLRGEIDILVHPSREESYGLALLEAMSARVPVIAGINSGAVPWTLDEGRAGLLVDVGSVRAVAEAMRTLAADPARAATLGEQGFNSARRRFGMEAVVDAYSALYDEVAGPIWR
jgi:L-malate glycosyltransferase